jgi:CRISPR-associated protein Cmx8
MDRDGQTHIGKRSQEDKQQHYAVAIPEVQALADFVRDYPRMLADLARKALLYRPAAAVIDLPAEGALAFLDWLAVLTGLSVESSALRHWISAVEYLHLVKDGNNVKTAASGRVSPLPKLLVGYRAIVAPKEEKGQPRYRNSLFRRGLLLALLAGDKWYRPFRQILSIFDATVFMRQPRKDDEKGPPQFADDATKKFVDETTLFNNSPERKERMVEALAKAAPPPVIVNRIVRGYLVARTQDKTGIKLESFTGDEDKIDWSKVPGDFNDGKRKLAESLFLEFRSRRDQAFVDHFAATFFSVTQRLNEVDRLELANMLTVDERRGELKTLTLLALSANS